MLLAIVYYAWQKVTTRSRNITTRSEPRGTSETVFHTSEPITRVTTHLAGSNGRERNHAQRAATSAGHVISLTGMNNTPQSDAAPPAGNFDCQVRREMTG